jgi:hypothetical protein
MYHFYFSWSYFDPCCRTKFDSRCTMVVSSFGPYHHLVRADAPTERPGLILTPWVMPLALVWVQSFWLASGTCHHHHHHHENATFQVLDRFTAFLQLSWFGRERNTYFFVGTYSWREHNLPILPPSSQTTYIGTVTEGSIEFIKNHP